MKSPLKLFLWLWFPFHCYGALTLLALWNAWYSNIPEEVMRAQRLFIDLDIGTVVMVIAVVMVADLAAHIVLAVRQQISVLLCCIFIFGPWLVAYAVFALVLPFFNGIPGA